MKFSLLTTSKLFILLTAIVFSVLVLTLNSRSSLALSNTETTVLTAQDAAALYARSCARCHGADGKAQTAKGKQTGATNFTSAKWQPSDAKGIQAMKSGKGKMPSFKDTLNEEQMKALMGYVRRFKQ